MARDVLIRLRKLSSTGKVPANAKVRFTPTVLRADAEGYILDDWFDVVMVGGEGTAEDLPTTDLNWAYKVEIKGHGAGANLKQTYDTWYVHLPEGEGPVNFEDLPRIDPTTLTPVNDPDPAWVAAVTAVFNDSVSTAVEPAMVTAAEDETSQFRSALNAASAEVVKSIAAPKTAVYVEPSGGDDTAALQAAADEAGLTGIVRAYGTFNISGPVWVGGHFDGTGATFNSTGPEGKLCFGHPTSDPVRGVTIHAPKMRYTAYDSATDWDMASVGLTFSNLVGSQVFIDSVSNFGTGMLVVGQAAKGNVYNTFYIGRLENNKVNQHIESRNNGWCNSNTFIGGQYSHLNNRGAYEIGATNIFMTGSGSWDQPNANVWLNPSIETSIAEHMMNIDRGLNNTWVAPRVEDFDKTSPVRWGPAAQKNVIFGGYDIDKLREVHVTGALYNAIYSATMQRIMGSDMIGGMRGGIHLSNRSAGESGFLTGYPVTWNGDTASNEWNLQSSANFTRYKSSGDTFPRVEVDHRTGRVRFGQGAAAPVVGFGAAGSWLRVDSRTSTTAPAAGAAEALPATPAGYVELYIDGAMRKLPYY